MILDLLFPARGDAVPTDHLYPLYGALSQAVPAFHDPDAGVRFAPLTGLADGPGRLRLTDRSHLRVRLPADAIPAVLPLAGRPLDVAGATVRLGPPSVVPLRPAPTLYARVVVVKPDTEPPLRAKGVKRPPVRVDLDPFLAAVRRKLARAGVAGEVVVPVVEAGRWAGTPRRRVVRIKKRAVVGYAVVVTGLTAADSVRLQEHGLGGRTRIGCGFFLPVRG